MELLRAQLSLNSEKRLVLGVDTVQSGQILSGKIICKNSFEYVNAFMIVYSQSHIIRNADKGPDHLGPGLGHLDRFLDSTRNRQHKFSAYA